MSLAPGTRIGPYEVVSMIGAGGMGEVYRARDITLGREVALKLLPDIHAMDRERRLRFEREAQVLAAMNHPNVAAIYGLETSGTPALVMELVEGPTLAERIAQGPLPVSETTEIARQLARALDNAHERGIIHRDLKPANIKIAADGTIKVLDFGLAKIVGGDTAPPSDIANSPTVSVMGTAGGVILGTAAYMSPEQARGQPVDKRTDIWAFGCVLFEMLTGRQAFSGATVSDLLAAILTQDPQWARLPSDVPLHTSQLLRRCLQKDPRARLRDMGDAFIDAPPPGQRRSKWAAIVAAGIVASVLGALLAAVFVRTETIVDDGLRPDRTVATQLTDYGGLESSPAISPDGRAFVFISDHGGEPDIWLRQIAGGEPVRLTNDPAPESDLIYAPDGESVYFTRNDAEGMAIWQTGVLGGRPRRILAGVARGAAPAPDGGRLAFLLPEGSNTWSLVVRALNSGDNRVLVRALPGSANRPAWSTDGRRLSYTRGGLFAPSNLFVIDIETGGQRQVTSFTRGNEGVFSHAWLPDNRHLVVSYVPFPRQLATPDIGILDVENGSISRLTTTVQRGLMWPSVSADGTRMVVASVENVREVWRIPARTGEPARLAGPRGDPMWIYVTRDARTLLFNSNASGSRNLWVARVQDIADARQITFVPGDAIAHSSLSPDGSRVAFVSTSTGNSDIWVQNVDGTDLQQLTNDAAADSWPVWSPDGRWLAYTSLRGMQQETWRIPTTGGTAEKLFDGFFRGDWQPQLGGNGTWIVTSSGLDRVRLLDVDRRTVIWDIRIPSSALSLPMFSPDGRSFSLPFQAGRDRDSIGIFDTISGERCSAIDLPFRVFFRASWVEQGSAFIVNRNASTSHIVLFDRFWSSAPEPVTQ
jgi:Tol biopolymer transport system component